jgi:hypothetical protein
VYSEEHVVTVKNYFSIIEEHLAEEQVDEPASEGEDKQNDKNNTAQDEEEEEEEEDMAMPVPQVKVGPDGQIILDEKSLVGHFFLLCWFTNSDFHKILCTTVEKKRHTIFY